MKFSQKDINLTNELVENINTSSFDSAIEVFKNQTLKLNLSKEEFSKKNTFINIMQIMHEKNPLLLGSWSLFKKKPNVSFILSIAGFVLMLSFLWVDEIIDNDGSTTTKVVSYGLGYWLWVLSSFSMIIGNFLNQKREK